MVPLENDPIISDTSIWLFGYLECQNSSIITKINYTQTLCEVMKYKSLEYILNAQYFKYYDL